jgi:hypothetical protein
MAPNTYLEIINRSTIFSQVPKSRFHLREKVKIKVTLEQSMKAQRGMEVYSSTLSLTSAIDRGVRSTLRPVSFTPGKDSVPFVQEDGWAPGPVWTRPENLVLIGIRSLERPARSKSLYRLSYPGLYPLCDI